MSPTAEAAEISELDQKVIDKIVNEVASRLRIPVVFQLDRLGKDLDLHLIYEKDEVDDLAEYKRNFKSELTAEFFKQGYTAPELDVFAYTVDDLRAGRIESYVMKFHTKDDPEYDLLKPVVVSHKDLVKINEAENGPVFQFEGKILTSMNLTDSSLTAVFLYPRMKQLYKREDMTNLPDLEDLYDNVKITKRGIINWKIQYLGRFVKEFIEHVGVEKRVEKMEYLNRLAKYDIRYHFADMLGRLDEATIDDIKFRYKNLLRERAARQVNVDNILAQIISEFEPDTENKRNLKINNFLRNVTQLQIYSEAVELSSRDRDLIKEYGRKVEDDLTHKLVNIDEDIYEDLANEAKILDKGIVKFMSKWKSWAVNLFKDKLSKLKKK